MSLPSQVPTIEDAFYPYGAIADLFEFGPQYGEIMLSGPAGTGKSRGALEYINYWCSQPDYPNVRCLMLRKTRRSLTESGMVTLERKVLHPAQGVAFHGTTQQYRYPNGSIIAVGGMDKPGKIMSSEWDIIYPQEATELVEGEWEAATTRLRNGRLPFQQIVGDCNPDAPHHWIRQRVASGKLVMLESRHEDNPTVTPDYLRRLDELTGVRLLRLRYGLWAAAEGLVYEEYDAKRHLIDRFDIPREWPRYISVDFGYTAPFVAQWWARDPDGRLYRYREIYLSRRTVDQHAERIKHLSRNEPIPRAVICDPENADGRAMITRLTGWGTIPAHKDISNGIQAVKTRLQVAGDGKPRIFLLRDVTDLRDVLLADAKKPTSTEQEVESYVWDVSNGRKKGEEPVDANNHGMDAMRYIVAHFDLAHTGVAYVKSFY